MSCQEGSATPDYERDSWNLHKSLSLFILFIRRDSLFQHATPISTEKPCQNVPAKYPNDYLMALKSRCEYQLIIQLRLGMILKSIILRTNERFPALKILSSCQFVARVYNCVRFRFAFNDCHI